MRAAIYHTRMLGKLLIICAACTLILKAQPCHAEEMNVRLLGQSCQLTGPLDLATLKAIHAVSPDQAFPPDLYTSFRPETAKQLKVSLEKIKAASPLPKTLEPYRDRVRKRLEALVAFFDGFNLSRKTRNVSGLIKATIQIAPEFKPLAKKLFNASAPQDEVGEKLLTAYLEFLGSDPEDEFHSVIRKLAVKYNCSYDESETSDDGITDSAPPSPTPQRP